MNITDTNGNRTVEGSISDKNSKSASKLGKWLSLPNKEKLHSLKKSFFRSFSQDSDSSFINKTVRRFSLSTTKVKQSIEKPRSLSSPPSLQIKTSTIPNSQSFPANLINNLKLTDKQLLTVENIINQEKIPSQDISLTDFFDSKNLRNYTPGRLFENLEAYYLSIKTDIKPALKDIINSQDDDASKRTKLMTLFSKDKDNLFLFCLVNRKFNSEINRILGSDQNLFADLKKNYAFPLPTEIPNIH